MAPDVADEIDTHAAGAVVVEVAEQPQGPQVALELLAEQRRALAAPRVARLLGAEQDEGAVGRRVGGQRRVRDRSGQGEGRERGCVGWSPVHVLGDECRYRRRRHVLDDGECRQEQNRGRFRVVGCVCRRGHVGGREHEFLCAQIDRDVGQLRGRVSSIIDNPSAMQSSEKPYRREREDTRVKM